MSSRQHVFIMEQLKQIHHQLLPLIQGKKIYYLDIPLHNNIGDLLIMQGTLRFLEENRCDIAYIASVYDYKFCDVDKNSIFLLHGGGNFGDLYPIHQRFRERIAAQYPDNRIVILPQTLYYESRSNYEASCRALSAHDDLHICVRDKVSFDMAKNMSEKVYLMPDMAHQLYPIKATQHPKQNRVIIQRVDKEASSLEASDYSPDVVMDWDQLLGKKVYISTLLQKSAHISKNLKYDFFRKNIIKAWLRYSNYLSRQAIDLFSQHRDVVSNRLHAHILATLMDKPNLIIDNSYGKNGTYIDCWTGESDLVTLER